MILEKMINFTCNLIINSGSYLVIHLWPQRSVIMRPCLLRILMTLYYRMMGGVQC